MTELTAYEIAAGKRVARALAGFQIGDKVRVGCGDRPVVDGVIHSQDRSLYMVRVNGDVSYWHRDNIELA